MWPYLFRDPGAVVYQVVISDGIAKFVISGNLLQKLWMSRLESTSLLDMVHNLLHVRLFGCFCLGIFTSTGKLKRYNRWSGTPYLLQELVEQASSISDG